MSMRSFFRRFYLCWRLAHRFQDARSFTHPVWVWMKQRLPFISANAITYVRTYIAAAAFYRLYEGDISAASQLYLVAALLDLVDGDWARANKEVSTWGKIVDPLVDKVTVMAFLFLFAYRGRASIAIVWTILALEAFSTSVYAITALQGSVVGSNLQGKAKKALQDASVLLMLFFSAPGLRIVFNFLLALSGLLSIASSWEKIKSSRAPAAVRQENEKSA